MGLRPPRAALRWIEVDTLKGETRTTQFLKLNGAGQVPVVEFDDGRTLAESNAIIRYLARGSDLIPADAFAAAKMDEWLFWEQYSHEPYIAVCRFQMVYLGKPASDLDPDRVKRGYAALARMEHHLAATRFLVGDASRSPTSRCWPIRGWRMRAAFTSTAMPRCGAGLARPNAARPAAGPIETRETSWPRFPLHHPPRPPRRCRRHCRDAGGRSARQRARTARRSAAAVLFPGFEALDRDPNIQLVVAEDGDGAVVGCLQLCILPGLSSQGSSRGLIEDVRVAAHCRSRGLGEQLVQWAVAEAQARGCRLVELLTHNSRVDAQRFYERLGFQSSHSG